MSEIEIHDLEGKVIGKMEVDDSLLNGKTGQVVHEAVVAFRANNRAGTASTLRKGEVRGSNKKPWRQKGTGRARAGYRQSPVWRGGGVAFGPHPRDFRKKVNKKAAKLAFRQIFGVKLQAGELRIIKDLNLENGKTKSMAGVLKALDIKGSVLIIAERIEKNALLAARNLACVQLVDAETVTTYELVKHGTMVVTEAAFRRLEARIKGGTAEKA